MAELPPPVRWWGRPLGEARVHLELARLLLSATWRGEDVPHGDGAPVLLVPGFLAGDVTLAALHDWLRRIGHRSYRSGIAWNVDCSEAAVRRLDRRLAEVADRSGAAVTLIGHSRGGLLARALATRSPERVRRVVALGSPLGSQLDASALTLAAVGGARLAQNLLRPHRPHCLTVRCPCPFGADLAAPATPAVVTIWTAEDGIVRPSACRPDGAEAHEVRGSHVGLGVNVHVYRHLAEVLVRP
ncbi:esterase/lipase family protein [Actinomycetospora cinnamomea]|uniref:Alpha/beta hydrolase family protein n=1 Tax=Actinomycetospora cinnamomea TaxID=663609 RepID=A0A2U1E8H5_9PSEU|nr:alpha/beta fold hydrolase [Actinomycetospora cinnamomea]PVY96172.1 alpha/beta hydrolase family protein [Actinomycetospora cinnamomea]